MDHFVLHQPVTACTTIARIFADQKTVICQCMKIVCRLHLQFAPTERIFVQSAFVRRLELDKGRVLETLAPESHIIVASILGFVQGSRCQSSPTKFSDKGRVQGAGLREKKCVVKNRVLNAAFVQFQAPGTRTQMPAHRD
ncbi:hypothetical protein M569_17738 [Genlisea aurea]|uniref:Uncharacterized protein n=1 Tax=Genlisea aurea TaxID=192259 RepID=S8DCK5_9LAMI|nr:hypothetical protein M569_17738 [Genlisea aurea]